MKSFCAALVSVVLLASALQGQATAVVRGSVTGPGAHPEAGEVVRAGGVSTTTGADGRYSLTIAPGRVQLTATRLGLAPESRTLELADGQEVQADFTMRLVPLQIDDLVVPQPDTLGVRRGSVMPGPVQLAAARTIPELLAGRVPGLQVRPGSGAVAAGSRLRLRGASGVLGAGEPLVVVNGMRVAAQPDLLTALDVGQKPSRLDDFVPDDIERIEVLSGPAAIARYGPSGAAGAVEVYTRGAEPGTLRFHGFAETGVRNDVTEYPANFGRAGRMMNGSSTNRCTLDDEAAGRCTPVGDSLLSFNPLMEASPFRTGGTRRAGASVSGGAGPLVFLGGGTAERDLGVLRRDSRERNEVRGSFTLHPRRGLELAGSALHLRNVLELPYEDGAFYGSIYGGLAGNPVDDPVRRGYVRLTPAERDTLGATQQVRRTLATASLRWLPRPWLTLGGRYGFDGVQTDEVGHERHPGDTVAHTAEGRRTGREAEAYVRAGYALPGLALSTTLGAERSSGRVYTFEELRGSPGQISVARARSRSRTAAVYARQGLEWRQRVHAALVVRRDEPESWPDPLVSAALSAAWDVDREAFFPRRGWVDGLRVRAAYARTDQDPAAVGAVEPGFCGPFDCMDDEPLKPQRYSELEGGVDAALLGSRLQLSLTAYRRLTDQLLAQIGRPDALLLTNSGRVVNRGAEARVRVGALFGIGGEWELVATGAVNRNRLEDYSAFIGGPWPQSLREGYPVGGFHSRRLTGFQDRNGDGLIGRRGCGGGAPTAECEVQLSAEPEYVGSPDPARMMSLRGRIGVRGVEFSTLLEHQGGVHRANLTGYFRCRLIVCQASFDPATPLAEQARVAAMSLGALPVEDASFTRLREAAVRVRLPQRWARRFGGVGAEFTVAGRNLVTWTPFGGLDPETSYMGTAAFAFGDQFTQPLPRTLTTRLDVRF
jgi:hypothetical protein